MTLEPMLKMLQAFVEAESPSSDVDACRECARQVAALGEELLGVAPNSVESGGRLHLHWPKGRGEGDTRIEVLVLGHLDTVWPLGTVDRWPFEISDGIATGPGVFDMKAGLVQGLFALSSLPSLDGVEVFFSSDEELGAPTSRHLIQEIAERATSTLVLEPSEAGALKVARKGCSMYQITAYGRASHAGLEPAAGRNALIEVAHQVLAIGELAQGATTVTPTVARVGTATNTVPAEGTLSVDVRAPTLEEQERVRDAIFAIKPFDPDVELEVTMTAGHPPMPRAASEALFERAKQVGARLGLGDVAGVEVGGASDGNFTAAAGCPTLDGLGAVGDGAHAEGEHVVIAKMPERTALVAALIAELTGGNR